MMHSERITGANLLLNRLYAQVGLLQILWYVP